MGIHVIKHPLINHKMGLLRQKEISTKDFREMTAEIARLLTYEATKDLKLETIEIEGWAGPVKVEQLLGKKITIVPILRAGLGMMNGVLDLIPSAKVSIVGLYRDEETLQPHTYYEKYTSNIDERLALVIDPMLATGGSLIETINKLKREGCQNIRVIVLVAAPEGVAALAKVHPEVPVFAASLDDHLNASGYILPGLGDAGDKIFGTK